MAAQYGHKDVAELLISKGCDVNAKDNLGRTPKKIARAWRHNDLVGLLVKHGGN